MARGDCPRCQSSTFSAPGEPYGAVRCTTCGGTFLFGRGSVRLIENDAGVTRATLMALAQEMGVPGAACAACEKNSVRVRVRDVDVDFCAACGGLFLDHGELWRLSRGKFVEPEKPVRIDAAPSPNDDGANPHDDHRNPSALVPLAAHHDALTDFAAPGRPMLDALVGIENFLGDAPTVSVRQKHRLGEVLVGIEMANQYTVSPAGGGVGFAKETTSGFLAIVARLVMPSIRALEIDIDDDYGATLFTARRPMFFLFSSMTVESNDGRILGKVERKFDFIHKSYELRNHEGKIFARIKSPFWRLWKFTVMSAEGREIALIQKNWGGLLRESMTDADSFTLDFQGHPFSVDERAVLLATLLSIDLDYFSRNGGKRGALGFLGG